MAKKVLVTGGTGFLGAYILQALLENGYAVRAIRRTAKLPLFIPQHILDQVEWVEGDLLDVVSLADALQDIDIVVHAAAMVSFHASDRKSLYKINIDGTANMVNLSIEAGVEKFVYISSVAALGRTSHGEMVDEKKKWQSSTTNTHYAISKHHAEREVWRGMGEGLDVIILNPSTIIGYGNWNDSSCKIFKSVYDEFPWYTEGVNGFVAVEDIATIVVRLLQHDEAVNERFIVNADNWTFKELFTQIATGFNKKPPYRKATPFMGMLAVYLEKIKSVFTGKKPLLTAQTAKVAHSKTYFSNQKLLKLLHDFQYTSLEKAIAEATQRYKEKSGH